MMLQRVDWEFPSAETEWCYVGLDDEFQTVEVQRAVDTRFEEPEILLVIDRRHTGPVDTANAAEQVSAALVGKDVILCDKGFQSFMHFDSHGVMRQGTVK